MPFEQSRDLARKLRKGVPVTCVEVITGGHHLDHEESRLEILAGFTKFLGQYLDD